MKECIVKHGERWDVCPDHENSKGVHGEFMCIHLDEKCHNGGYTYNPQYCKLKYFNLPDDLFYLEK